MPPTAINSNLAASGVSSLIAVASVEHSGKNMGMDHKTRHFVAGAHRERHAVNVTILKIATHKHDTVVQTCNCAC